MNVRVTEKTLNKLHNESVQLVCRKGIRRHSERTNLSKGKEVVKRHDQTCFEGTQHLGVKRCCERSKLKGYFVITVNYVGKQNII